MQTWDVIVIGGSAAGLSGALTLVRARRRVLVLDSGSPRNRFTRHMHAVLGRDDTPPARLVADGRDEVERYGGVVRPGQVTDVARAEGGFAVTTTDGVLHARRVLVATGETDVLPEVEGLRELWGRGVAMCPYCDAWEAGDGLIGVLATGPGSTYQAQLLRQWSEHIVYFPHGVGEPDEATARALAARGIQVAEGQVARVTSDEQAVLTGIEMVDGRRVPLAAVFLAPTLVPRDEFLTGLAPERTETPAGSFIAVDPNGATSIPGVWAAGNVCDPYSAVPVAMGAGAKAAGMINHDLVMEDVALAVAAAE